MIQVSTLEEGPVFPASRKTTQPDPKLRGRNHDIASKSFPLARVLSYRNQCLKPSFMLGQIPYLHVMINPIGGPIQFPKKDFLMMCVFPPLHAAHKLAID